MTQRGRTAWAMVVTCEHGGNAVPRRWAPLFQGRQRLLDSHRGYDIGAAAVARIVARAFRAPLFVATTTRLLVDLNRSLGHPRSFSEATRDLPEVERRRIIHDYYEPHRGRVEDAVEGGARVLHIAVHSFTPVLDGVPRRADVGLLYDPRRPGERALADRWRRAILRVSSSTEPLVVRRNYPYRGDADGFTTALRRKHSPQAYVGIELELNQARLSSRSDIMRMARLVVLSLRSALE